MTDDETQSRQTDAKLMKTAQTARKVTLETIRTRCKCTGEEAFKVLNGAILEGEVRDRIFAFLCPPPPVQPAPPPPAPVAPEPKAPPVVVDLITRPSERGKSVSPEVGAPYQPPQPDPVPPVEITLRENEPLDEKGKATVAAIAREILGLDGKPLAPLLDDKGRPIYPVPPAGAKSDPICGQRIREAMKQAGHSARHVATLLGHSAAGNVSACLGKTGARTLQIRLCRFYALDAMGIPVPGLESDPASLKADRTPRARSIVAPAPTTPGQAERTAKYSLPPSPRATDAVSPTLLNEAQSAAAVELALASQELNLKTRERNQAARRYKLALEAAEAAGVRFALAA